MSLDLKRCVSQINHSDAIKSALFFFFLTNSSFHYPNTVRFQSNCCKIWRFTLHKRGYIILHFHLNPTQVGLPNDRPRYYCAAVLTNIASCQKIIDSTVSLDQPLKFNKQMEHGNMMEEEIMSKFVYRVLKMADAHYPTPPIINITVPLCTGQGVASTKNFSVLPALRHFLDSDIPPLVGCDHCSVNSDKLKLLRISPKVLNSTASWCFDVVTENDSRTACFTHSYGKFIRGTGSILFMGNSIDSPKDNPLHDIVTNETKYFAGQVDSIDEERKHCQKRNKFSLLNPKDRMFEEAWAKDISSQELRYFSGSEIGRLMGFPIDADVSANGEIILNEGHEFVFRFPETCSIRSQWKLLGNSLNVRVAACVAELGLGLLLADNIEV